MRENVQYYLFAHLAANYPLPIFSPCHHRLCPLHFFCPHPATPSSERSSLRVCLAGQRDPKLSRFFSLSQVLLLKEREERDDGRLCRCCSERRREREKRARRKEEAEEGGCCGLGLLHTVEYEHEIGEGRKMSVCLQSKERD